MKKIISCFNGSYISQDLPLLYPGKSFITAKEIKQVTGLPSLLFANSATWEDALTLLQKLAPLEPVAASLILYHSLLPNMANKPPELTNIATFLDEYLFGLCECPEHIQSGNKLVDVRSILRTHLDDANPGPRRGHNARNAAMFSDDQGPQPVVLYTDKAPTKLKGRKALRLVNKDCLVAGTYTEKQPTEKTDGQIIPGSLEEQMTTTFDGKTTTISIEYADSNLLTRFIGTRTVNRFIKKQLAPAFCRIYNKSHTPKIDRYLYKIILELPGGLSLIKKDNEIIGFLSYAQHIIRYKDINIPTFYFLFLAIDERLNNAKALYLTLAKDIKQIQHEASKTTIGIRHRQSTETTKPVFIATTVEGATWEIFQKYTIPMIKEDDSRTDAVYQYWKAKFFPHADYQPKLMPDGQTIYTLDMATSNKQKIVYERHEESPYQKDFRKKTGTQPHQKILLLGELDYARINI